MIVFSDENNVTIEYFVCKLLRIVCKLLVSINTFSIPRGNVNSYKYLYVL